VTQSFKVCPSCKTQTSIAATRCPSCGYAFVTQFVQQAAAQIPQAVKPSAFMRTVVCYRRLSTAYSPAQVLDATALALREVGGNVQVFNNEIFVQDGAQGVDFAFTATIDARVVIVPVGPNTYDIRCEVYARPNVLFWVCAFLGFCTLLFWVVNVLFFVMNMQRPYQAALDRITLPDAPPLAPRY
jgi:hypothetical protein